MQGLSTSLVEKGQKLDLLDVGFAGVSSVPMISSKVGLGSEPVSGPWMARRPSGPQGSGCASTCSAHLECHVGDQEALDDAGNVLRHVEVHVAATVSTQMETRRGQR